MSEAECNTWDKHIENDLLEGRLNKLIANAHDDHKQGLTLSFEEGHRVYQHMLEKKQTQPK